MKYERPRYVRNFDDVWGASVWAPVKIWANLLKGFQKYRGLNLGDAFFQWMRFPFLHL